MEAFGNQVSAAERFESRVSSLERRTRKDGGVCVACGGIRYSQGTTRIYLPTNDTCHSDHWLPIASSLVPRVGKEEEEEEGEEEEEEEGYHVLRVDGHQ
ncbi:hypothetical protein O3P69_003323 [Scylla paramamosain]|uniref:Uncharacterized protein n=1 Tax=Scylla paramamosain TaxID=85552 RepID=A0AAW0UMW3_SCYPA